VTARHDPARPGGAVAQTRNGMPALRNPRSATGVPVAGGRPADRGVRVEDHVVRKFLLFKLIRRVLRRRRRRRY